MSRFSGKFLIRTDPQVHAALAALSQRRGVSLNKICHEKLSEVLAPALRSESPTLLATIRDVFPSLIAIYLFGSVARGESTEASDTDYLLVLPEESPVQRDLYRIWDERVASVAKAANISPHFVALPSGIEKAGSLWLENAMEGIPLWQANHLVHRFLMDLRSTIARGEITPLESQGHRYWVRNHEK